MDNSATVEPTKHDESISGSEKDRERDRRPDTALEMVNKFLPKICGSELGKECEFSVDFHVFIPSPHKALRSKENL